jgi:thiol-disulfide isomerase/thioredoxin
MAAVAPAGAADRNDPLDLARYKGKVVYLDFWASWCGPCKLSFPYMERMTAAYSRSAFVVIAVNVDHSRARADAFLNQVGADIPVVYDPKGTIAAKFHVTEMPTSILIGRDGRVHYVHQGFFEDKTPQYESHIEELISEK